MILTCVEAALCCWTISTNDMEICKKTILLEEETKKWTE